MFTIKRDFLKQKSECDDYDEFDFDTYSYVNNSDCEFTEEEKKEIMNLYENGDFDDWLEW